jgi:hypothetical protein
LWLDVRLTACGVWRCLTKRRKNHGKEYAQGEQGKPRNSSGQQQGSQAEATQAGRLIALTRSVSGWWRRNRIDRCKAGFSRLVRFFDWELA